MTDIDLQTLSLCIQALHAERQRILGLIDAGRGDAELQTLACDHDRAMDRLAVLYRERQQDAANHPECAELLRLISRRPVAGSSP